ncbi:MAG TPA: MarR family transcriptional regulator [Solirubrobacterales bacterium]|jgi:DNA-binding MarR family transcriptional regulator|nr:MarR family transcriptional regulator [Solirubrobacterales bacterium]
MRQTNPLEVDRRQEADALRLAITRTARRLRQEAGGGLSPTVIATLASIERHKVVTPGELARIEGVQRPTMTRAISRLADAGLIDRREDPEDRRSALISVSQEGHRYLEAHRSRKSAWLANLIEEMPQEDADTLSRAAEILSHALESHKTGEFSLPEDR